MTSTPRLTCRDPPGSSLQLQPMAFLGASSTGIYYEYGVLAREKKEKGGNQYRLQSSRVVVVLGCAVRSMENALKLEVGTKETKTFNDYVSKAPLGRVSGCPSGLLDASGSD